MTFANFPKRSSSEGDILDLALNAWVSSEHSIRHSYLVEESPPEAQIQTELVTDALDFHRWADNARRTDPAATGPVADTWNRVLRATAQISNRGGDMNSVAMSTELQSAPVYKAPSLNRQHISRYLNYAASLLIVFGVAFAGAFMSMQIHQREGSDPRFAASVILPERSGNDVCDVDSLTIDEAIEIVQSPLFYVYGGEENARADGWGQILDEGDGMNFVGAPHRDWSQLTGLTPHSALPVSEEEFFAAHATAEEYRDCLQNGTRGQMWALFDPVVVQYEIATRIPLLQPIEESRVVIEQLLNEPTVGQTTVAANDRKWRVNPNGDLAVRVDHGMTFHTQKSILLPIQILDRDGEIVGSYDIYGNRLPDAGFGSGEAANIVVAYSRVTGNWYVVGSYEANRFHEPEIES